MKKRKEVPQKHLFSFAGHIFFVLSRVDSDKGKKNKLKIYTHRGNKICFRYGRRGLFPW